MIDWPVLGIALIVVVGVCLYTLGYWSGHRKGKKEARKFLEKFYDLRPMVQVPYPEDSNVAREILEAVSRGIQGGK